MRVVLNFFLTLHNRLTETLLTELMTFPLPEPLSRPTLTVVPNLTDISEGDELFLICSIKGTPPVHFKLYRTDNQELLYNHSTGHNHTNYKIPVSAKEHSGKYQCEAKNSANSVKSDPVIIEGETFSWVFIFSKDPTCQLYHIIYKQIFNLSLILFTASCHSAYDVSNS